jgi:hypothetical protein
MRSAALLFCTASLALALAACGADRPLAPAPRNSPSALLEGASVGTQSAGSEKRGTITIALNVFPDGPVDVPFTSVGKKLADFTLDDDADPVLPSSITFDKVKPGTYIIDYHSVTGFTLAGIICTSNPNGGSGIDNNIVFGRTGVVAIQLEAAESVECTFAVLREWQAGDLITYSQAYWSDDATASGILVANFSAVYSSAGWLEVGILGPTGFSMFFTSASAVRNYLPAEENPIGPLDANLVNPLTTSSGAFGGEVTALALNVDFSDAGLLSSIAGFAFGDLSLCGLIDLPQLNGLAVRDFLGVVNTALGGGSAVYTIDQLYPVVVDLNSSFGVLVSSFAEVHLVAGGCPFP